MGPQPRQTSQSVNVAVGINLTRMLAGWDILTGMLLGNGSPGSVEHILIFQQLEKLFYNVKMLICCLFHARHGPLYPKHNI